MDSNLRLPDPKPNGKLPDPIEIAMDDDDDIVNNKANGHPDIVLGDGSVIVTFDLGSKPSEDDTDDNFYANLASKIDEDALAYLADDLLRGIEQDEESRREWLEERAEGIRLLGLKIEKPGVSVEGSAPVEGQSRIRHPMLLEAVLRFQANARGELLPSGGPVKVKDDSTQPTLGRDEVAEALEKDMNHFLTAVATEYYPDTDRMLLMTGFGGSGFKKIYRNPIKRRPMSESVDAADLVISNAATDLANADRITHLIRMRPSTLKRMQLIGAYRDTPLTTPSPQGKSPVDEAKENVAGVSSANLRPEDEPYQICECYCLTDIKGYEHKEDGEITGIPLPYKVTIERQSRVILEVRRDWDQDDDMQIRRRTFVKFPFVPGFGFYDLGLVHIMGNTTVAATALWRLMLDNGFFANFPGFLYADETGRQITNIFRVPPGGGAPIKTNGMPINQAVMPLPYKETGPSTMALGKDIVDTGSRIGGTAELQVGEGRQDAPVGTTIAMIEQAMKVMDAVHKRLHQAQAEEFSLLKDLFKENPEDFWRSNKNPAMPWTKESFLAAVNDNNFVPAADPNTASHVQRVLRAQALYMMAQATPDMFNLPEVAKYVLHTLGVSNPETILAPPGMSSKPDPKAEADRISAQADLLDAQTKAADLTLKDKHKAVDDRNRDLDRESKLKIAAMNVQREQMVQSSQVQHEQAKQARDHQFQHDSQMRDLVSSHLKQQQDQQHDMLQQRHDQHHEAQMEGLWAALNPPAPPTSKTKRARGGRTTRKPTDRPSWVPASAKKSPIDGRWYIHDGAGWSLVVPKAA